MKNCPYCGQPNQDSAKFCTSCGAALTEQAPDTNTVSNSLYAEKPSYTPSEPIAPAPAYAPATAYAPAVTTKKEFIQLPENAKLKKELKTSGILCYVCAGITLVMGLLGENYYIILDVALLVGLGLGIHLKQSKGCAIALAIYAVINMIVGLSVNGQPSGWLILLAGVYAVIYSVKLDKAWKQYQQEHGGIR